MKKNLTLIFILLLLWQYLYGQKQILAKDSLTVVFVTGDDEYHSREVMLPYANLLNERFGFKIIYIKDEAPGADLAPNHDPQPSVLPHAERIKEADLMVVFMRFRAWEPISLKLFMDHFDAGKPAIGIRTATHAFWRDRTFSPKYFGGHYKTHHMENLVGQVNPLYADHPMARGVTKKFYRDNNGPYVSTPLTEGAIPIVLSYGHNRNTPGIGSDSFDSPQFPIAWTFNYNGARRAMITLGNDRTLDHEWEVMLNLFYNSVFWSLGYEVPMGGVLAAGKEYKMVKEKEPFKPSMEPIPAPPEFVAGEGWEILFNGKDISKWKHWDVSIPPYGIPLDHRANSEGPIDYTLSPARWKVEDGVLIAQVGYGDIITKAEYSDYQLRLDYFIPKDPEWVENEWRGNSGVFLNGSFEIALLDSYGKDKSVKTNGAIYRVQPPDVEASKPAGEWQTLEISFVKSKATVTLNGVAIHREVELNQPTFNGFPASKSYASGSWQEEAGIISQGPIRLQAENSYVRFANIAIKPIPSD
jgi:hypothetical protein